MAGEIIGDDKLLEGSRGGGLLAGSSLVDSAISGGREENDMEVSRHREGAEDVLPLGSKGILKVELLLDCELGSHPYMFDRLSCSSFNFPLPRVADPVELFELVELDVMPVMLLPVDRDVCNGRLVAAYRDCLSMLTSLLALSLAV